MLGWVSEENAGGASILIICAAGIGMAFLVELGEDWLSKLRYRRKLLTQQPKPITGPLPQVDGEGMKSLVGDAIRTGRALQVRTKRGSEFRLKVLNQIAVSFHGRCLVTGKATWLDFNEIDRAKLIDGDCTLPSLNSQGGPMAPSTEYKCFFDALADANLHHRSVADTCRAYGFETDLVRILGHYTAFALNHAQYLETPQDTRILECNPAFLAHLWSEMLNKHYTILASLAEFSRVSITSNERPRLFRQVYLFYDVLWGGVLLPTRIEETRRVQTTEYPNYLARFREEATATLTRTNLPFTSHEEVSIFGDDAENKEDWAFYTHGELNRAFYKKDYADILRHLRIESDGSPLELIARLHFRTCQVLDLSHKMSFMELDQWWKLHYKLSEKHIEAMDLIIPIP